MAAGSRIPVWAVGSRNLVWAVGSRSPGSPSADHSRIPVLAAGSRNRRSRIPVVVVGSRSPFFLLFIFARYFSMKIRAQKDVFI